MKKDFIAAVKVIYCIIGLVFVAGFPVILVKITNCHFWYLLMIITVPILLALYVVWLKKVFE